MFGFDYPQQSQWPYGGASGASPPGCSWDTERAKWPIREDQHRPESFWLSNGLRDYPPPEGVFLEIESGGTLTLDLNENRAFTRWRWPESKNPDAQFAGQTESTLHTVNNFDEPADIAKFGGTALAIAYTSDAQAVRGADFTVISTNWASPWLALTAYPLPRGLPPCPPGGCLCTWNWLHTAGNTRHNPNPPARPEGEGYGDELYNVLFRCTVTGAVDANNVVPKGAVPTQCDDEGAKGNCTTGPKTPIIAWMAEGNNVFPPEDVHARAKWRKPSYTWRYGFSDGAQQDAVVPKGQEASANGVGSVSDQPRGNPFESGTGGLAVVNARGEALWPGVLHADTVAWLERHGRAIGTANATADGSVAESKPAAGSEPADESKPAGDVDFVQSNVAVEAAGSNSTAPELGNVHLAGDDKSASSAAASSTAAAPLASPAGNNPPTTNATIPDSGANSPLNVNGTNPNTNTPNNATNSTVPIGQGTAPKPSGKTKCLRRRKRRMAHH
jgi:hypothetical protein